MVSVTLLAVIMIGLLSMFQHTQRALHVAVTQSDVFENIRGAIQLVSRDLTEMTAYGEADVTNAVFKRFDNQVPTVTLPSGIDQNLRMYEVFWLTRVNDQWQGIGYYVSNDPVIPGNAGVGTLYRFAETASRSSVPGLLRDYNSLTFTNHRVSDGIVHFSLEAVYLSGANGFGQPIFTRGSPSLRSNDLPAFVDVEIGVLEPATLKQFQALSSVNVASAQTFLADHVGKIHFFRERVPIRNFINPYRANEVP